jgi:hypothetical protein
VLDRGDDFSEAAGAVKATTGASFEICLSPVELDDRRTAVNFIGSAPSLDALRAGLRALERALPGLRTKGPAEVEAHARRLAA